MMSVILRRLAFSIPMIIVIASLTFMLVNLIPGDPALAILGPEASAAEYERVREELGLNRPLVMQYADWMWGALRGDFGVSLRTGQPVTGMILERLPVTLSLSVVAIIVTAVVGILIGLVGVLRGGAVGKISQVVAVLGSSLPNFWLGIVLVVIFAVGLGWLPATGYVPFTKDPGGWASHLVLPVAAIALAGVAAIARQTRASMVDVLGRDYIRTLLAAGTPRGEIIYKHALRNAAIPVVTSLSFQFIGLLSGAVIVDQVFALPGLGQVLLVAISGRDVPVVQGAVIFSAIIVIVVNLAVDLVNAWLNPKVRS